jgi:hypothetical protein
VVAAAEEVGRLFGLEASAEPNHPLQPTGAAVRFFEV